MTETYKIIRRNYEAVHGKPSDPKRARLRRNLYRSIESVNSVSIESIEELYRDCGVTVELNDGVRVG